MCVCEGVKGVGKCALGRYVRGLDIICISLSHSLSLSFSFSLSGEAFLTATSEILCSRGGPKLAVGGACTSVAVDLGDLEGRGPELLGRWEEREKKLVELIGWHSFRLSNDQVS